MDVVVLANRYKVHHFRNLEEQFRGKAAYEESYDPAAILKHKPALVVCFDEHYCELGNAIGALKQHGVATLQVMDGILEWRRTWDYTREGHSIDGVANPLNQPALSDKIACLGRRDARILESWGNFGKCEIVGAPRMDGLIRKRMAGEVKPVRPAGRKPRVLVMTAKTPGFTEQQVRTTTESLADLKAFFDEQSDIDVVWRLTQQLDRELGIENRLADLTGGELHAIIEEVDAVITTPSTSLLEAMLLSRPTALLDYHNCPHYFETAWSIYCPAHIAPVVHDLLDPPAARMDYQDFLLDEQLECKSPASDRLARLIEGMLEVCGHRAGEELAFPVRMLDDADLFVSSPLPLGEFKRCYPAFPVPDDLELREMKIEVAAARGTIQTVYERLDHLTRRLDSIPGYRLLRKMKSAIRHH
jgi:hypothetical protein